MRPMREKRIKSADRVLEIFEMFSASRQSVTVMDVARELDMPQSSTSELLGSLQRRGYLQRDRGARTFRPTARVALLGAWVQPQLFRRGLLLPMMDELAATTGRATVLAMMVGVGIRHVHAVGGDTGDAGRVLQAPPGHLLHSPFGLALMSIMHCDTVRKLVHRLNAESPVELNVRPAEIGARLERARKQGYVMGGIGEGRSAVAMVLPHAIGEEQLAIGLEGPDAAIAATCDTLVQGLRGAIAARLARRGLDDGGVDWREVAAERRTLAAVH